MLAAFGGSAGGFTSGDLGSSVDDVADSGEIGQRVGSHIAVIVGAASGGEDATCDAEVIHLMEVADVQREPRDGLAQGIRKRCLRGESIGHIARFLEELAEQAVGLRVVQLCPMGGGDETVIGKLLLSITRCGESADDGTDGVR